MAEEKDKAVQPQTEKTSKKAEKAEKNEPVKEAEYDVETLANSGLFCSKSIVRAAMRSTGKKKATISEARKIVKQF